MRKILISILLVIMIIFCYVVVVHGIHIGSLSFNNYSAVKDKSNEIDYLIANLQTKNTSEYENKKVELSSAVKEYKQSKEEYEFLVESNQMDAGEEVISYSAVDLYDIDFLWTIIGNYATEEGVTLQFDVTKNSLTPADSTEYVICDLAFKANGDYIAITDFIYDIEDDDRLNFEINDFKMEKGLATFNVKEVPVNNKNLSSFSTYDTTDNLEGTDGSFDSNSRITDHTIIDKDTSSEEASSAIEQYSNQVVNY